MKKRMCRIGDVYASGNDRFVVMDAKQVRVGDTSLGVVYTVLAVHANENGTVVVNGDHGSRVSVTRSMMKLCGWKLVAGPTFDDQAAAAAARASVEAALTPAAEPVAVSDEKAN